MNPGPLHDSSPPIRVRRGIAATIGWAGGGYLGALLVATLVFFPVTLARTHSFLCNFDASVQSYAWHVANLKAIRHGTPKLWDFTTSSGTSFIGEMQTAPLYPITWLWALAPDIVDPQWLEWKIVAHFALALMGCFVLLRRNKIGPAGAAAGAAIFSLVGSIALRAPAQPNIFESLVYLPCALLAGQMAARGSVMPWRNLGTMVGGIVFALMVLAGHIQPAVHAGLAVVGWVLVENGRNGRALLRAVGNIAAIAVLAGMIAAPQLMATHEYINLSYRWIGADNPTQPPHRIPYDIYGFLYVFKAADFRSLIDPNHHGAESATLFFTRIGLLLAAFSLIRPTRLTLFGLILCSVAVLVAMGDGSWLGKASYHVPLVGSIRQPVRILCLFQLGAAMLVAGGVDRLASWLAGRKLVLYAMGFVLTGVGAWEIQGQAASLVQPRSAPFYPGNFYAPPADIARLIPRQDASFPSRYEITFPGLLPPNYGNVSGALSTRGHRATMQMGYYDYLAKDWNPVSENFRRLGLEYVISREPLPGLAWTHSQHENGVHVYRAPEPLSVFYIIFGRIAQSARLDNIQWQENSVKLTLSSRQSGRLCFAQPYYRGWQARVDGRKVEIENHDGLMSIPLVEPAREVSFIYAPKWLTPLAALSVLTSMLITFGLFGHLFRRPT